MKFASSLLYCGCVTALDIWSTSDNASVMLDCEGNPLQLYIMQHCGLCVAMGARCVSTVLAILLLVWLRKRPPIAATLLTLWLVVQSVCLWSIVDFGMVYLYFRYTQIAMGMS